MKIVTKSIGSGGAGTNKFINEEIVKRFSNDKLNKLRDASLIEISSPILISTDSFTIYPEFFPGGDIGKLSVFGTCNDIAVSGGIPEYLSFSLVLPDGYDWNKLEKILDSTKKAADLVGVEIVTGDTKVVDGITTPIINTTGIGKLRKDLNDYSNIKLGDKVIITSDIARHSVSILLTRGDLGFEGDIESDCCNLYDVIKGLDYDKVSFCRDATRGGVAAVLNEITSKIKFGFYLHESKIPISDNVKYFCEMIGMNPLQMANEGVAVLIVDSDYANDAVNIIRESENGRKAEIVGEVINENMVLLKTEVGGERVVDIPVGELLPRIC
ncbi:hydrogenase expression/formation protein HypE [Deferribacter desulfuricans SSM1]|uniref:Hydrogenase expression/formation protein HypE n=1 Tax=Deferribacter desulfuricans (strain DSM 14783 / JCM 11476 / NBRC 101012 / SSM1) TaxID=639282 RepID=D3P8Z5_DEFDS|nr:hydrogenase expression/formation protein HypE [Deferribacter desulfuricans]BAI81185.1 hydrogenase expression/formation protein HypE [Deferribacter desulfuricans SSM1]